MVKELDHEPVEAPVRIQYLSRERELERLGVFIACRNIVRLYILWLVLLRPEQRLRRRVLLPDCLL